MRRAAVAVVASVAVLALAILVWPSLRGDRTDAERIIAADAPAAATSAPAAETPQVVRASNTSPAPAPSAPAPSAPAQTAPAAVATSGPSETPAATDARPNVTEGQIVVTSEPAGARVTINGVGWGETPLTVKFLPLGTKRVRLTMQGYVSQERVVSIGPERPNARVNVELQARDAGAAERH
jgi:hypothetical protein